MSAFNEAVQHLLDKHELLYRKLDGDNICLQCGCDSQFTFHSREVDYETGPDDQVWIEKEWHDTEYCMRCYCEVSKA